MQNTSPPHAAGTDPSVALSPVAHSPNPQSPDDLPSTAGTRRRLLQAGALLAATPLAARADPAYPSRPVTLVVPQPVGGDADAVCRLLAPRMSKELGQPLVIDNRGGAAGNIGVAFGAKAAPDGYTVTFVNQGILAFNPSLYANQGFAPDQLVPVVWMTTTDLVFCVNPAHPARTMAEFIALARRSPGKYTYGTAGNGSANHLATKYLESLAGIELAHVPYKGGGPAIVDAVGGQIDAVMAFPLGALPHLKSGRLRALAVTGAKRAVGLPDVPTIAESGVAGYAFSSWFGLVLPHGAPADVAARIEAATVAALKEPDTVAKLRAGLTEPVGEGPDALRGLIARESQKWSALIRQYGIKAD